MSVKSYLEDHPERWVDVWIGNPGLFLNPIYYSRLLDLGRLYAVVVFEPNSLQIDGPAIPVHAVISNEYVTCGDPQVVNLIRSEVLRLKKLNPKMSVEYQSDDEVKKEFGQNARGTSSPK